ncbi:MAG TPA: sugar transferase [Pyrinomonadaceae bacterium]|nr:sugar transferase [Pyrinomonadaceae bacterium]
MNAVISGTAGRALLIDGNSLKSFDVNDPSNVMIRQQSDLPFLFGEGRDLRIIENSDIESIAGELRADADLNLALDLTLISLDPELETDIRKDALTDLDELLADNQLVVRLENVLYARPMPEDGDLIGALKLCADSRLAGALGLLRRFEEHQSVIAQICAAWDVVPTKLFGSHELKVEYQHAAVREGLFRSLVVSLASAFQPGMADSQNEVQAKLSTFFVTAGLNSSLKAWRNHRQIMQAWSRSCRESCSQVFRTSTEPVLSPAISTIPAHPATAHNGRLSRVFLKLSDLVLLLISLGLTIMYRHPPARNPSFVIDYFSDRINVTNAVLGLLLIISWHFAFEAQGLYSPQRLRPIGLELKEISRAVLVSSLTLVLFAVGLGGSSAINWRTVAMFGLVGFALIGSMRVVLLLTLRQLHKRGYDTKTLLIVGGGARGQRLASLLNLRQDLGYRVLGYVESDPAFAGAGAYGARWMGRVEELPRILATEAIDEVAIALPIKSQYLQIATTIGVLEDQGIRIHLLSDLFPRTVGSQPNDLGAVSFVLPSAPLFSWRTMVKRIFDLVVATFLLLISAPVLVVVAIAIKIDSRGRIFFVQERVGLNRRRFRMLKFRTMAEARMSEIEHMRVRIGPIFKIRNDPRLTRIGRWLRKTRIDGLPQLINVLLGDMSIVGPRPLSVRDVLRMEEAWQQRRFSVKPGLTSLWQLSGRSNLSFEQWMELDLEYIDKWSNLSFEQWMEHDLEYIDKWSLELDARILFRTVNLWRTS